MHIQFVKLKQMGKKKISWVSDEISLDLQDTALIESSQYSDICVYVLISVDLQFIGQHIIRLKLAWNEHEHEYIGIRETKFELICKPHYSLLLEISTLSNSLKTLSVN